MSFAAFLHHYGSTGREFGDGYARRWFEDMSEAERAQAREMLQTRGLAGNDVDVHGLAYVGDAATITTLDAAGRRASDPTWDVARLETLFALTGDRRHLDAMIAWVDDADEKARQLAANALSRQAIPHELVPNILARIEDGRHETLLLPLVNAWLQANGVLAGSNIEVFQQHLPLHRAIKATRPAARLTLLDLPLFRSFGPARLATRRDLLEAAVKR